MLSNNSHHLLLLILLSFLPFLLYPQNDRCGFDERMQQELSANPEYQKKLQLFEKAIRKGGYDKSDTMITVPVVFHIIYRTEAQNISNRQIISQLEVLNQDYRMLNSDTNLVDPVFPRTDSRIEFCFAGKDTAGADFSGVTRTKTDSVNIGRNSSQLFKLQPVWDSRYFLNIYVCEIGGGIAGYSSYPGGDPEKDAVVIDYVNFGRNSLDPNYNLGRTATHEVGHWLGLYHLWGLIEDDCSEDDLVADTPNQGKVYNSCPTSAKFSCGSRDMTSNYMGYVLDRCMAAFTPGQAQRMRNMINISRPLISSGIPCSTNPIVAEDENREENNPIQLYPNPTEEYVYIYRKSSSFSSNSFQLFTIAGQKVRTKVQISVETAKIDMKGLGAGTYVLKIRNGGNTISRKFIYTGQEAPW